MSEAGDMSDVERAFAERQGKAVEKESARAQRKRKVKEARRVARNTVAMDPSGMPPYCTLKTATVHAFYTAIGTMVNDWKEEASNMELLNPHNPGIVMLANNINRCAVNLGNILKEHIEQVELDNAEMQKKAEAIAARQEKTLTVKAR
jgi:hypothetical protein